ncbi:MAG: thiamine-binding protein [Acidimicrobiia bacterium]|nr:thiamine-binding protein [Acidimicrobiia bacterium]
MIAEIQVLPSPPGTEADRWSHVEAAIALIETSGLRYEVGPLGTSVEGEPDEVWALLRLAHEAVLAAGADGVVTVIKVEQTADAARQPTIGDLVDKFRP